MIRNSKRFLLLILSLFILGTFISACGGSGKSTPPNYPFIPIPTPTPTVSPTPEPTPTPTPEKYPIELSQTEFTVNVGATDNITVTLNGQDITQTATYTVDQEAIASVEQGLITGLSVGVATVTVHADEAIEDKTFTVNVIDPSLPTLEVEPSEINLIIEETTNVTVKLEGKDVTEDVKYDVDKKFIATAEKGVVKAGIQAGIENNPLVANITVSLAGANSATFTVNVIDDSNNEVTLDNDILDQLHELGIIAKGSADKTELTEANIPAIFKYNGTKYKITSISEGIFKDCVLLETVTIPESLTSIESGAFSCCSLLKEIIIPNSVTSIGGGAFGGCSSLESVNFVENSSLTSIGDGAFSRCNSLKKISIPDSVISIGLGPFGGCNALEKLTIGNRLTEIKDGLFAGLSSLQTITIGNGVKSIGIGAFNGCTSLESVTFVENSSLTTIGMGAFSNNSSLKEITIPNSVTTIEIGAFDGCTNSALTIAIPNSVTTIGSNAFGGVAEITYTSQMTATGTPWGAKKVNGVVQ